MKLNCNSFFDGIFTEINLNDYLSSNGFTDCSKPRVAQKLIDKIGYLTYGGYGENRKDIFQNSYLAETKNFYHLGIDINVPKGTPIRAPFDCVVVDTFIDPDKDIGWGGRMIIKKLNSDHYLVLAHVNPKTLLGRTRRNLFLKGDIMSEVGTWPTNGNTFQHLHVQCIKHNRFHDFDGYGTTKDLKDNPNPFEVKF